MRKQLVDDLAVPANVRALVGSLEFLSGVGAFFSGAIAAMCVLYVGLQVPMMRWPSMLIGVLLAFGVIQTRRWGYVRLARWALTKGRITVAGSLGGGSSPVALPAAPSGARVYQSEEVSDS